MSENEAYEAQGRAHASLKRLKSEIATIKAELLRRNQLLAAVCRMVEQFVVDPARHDPHAPVPQAITIQHHLNHEIDAASMCALVDELVRKSGEMKILEEQIGHF